MCQGTKRADDELISVSEPKRRRPPLRKTVPVPTNISPAMLERARIAAEGAGYRSLRAYLEALIAQGLIAETPDEFTPNGSIPNDQLQALATAYPSSAWALGPAVLMHRTVAALEAVAERTRAGEDIELLHGDLMSLRWEIGQTLLALRADYDREVAKRDARYYGHFGGIE